MKANPTLKVLDQHPAPARTDDYDRVFQKALKFQVIEGDVLGFCRSCDDWYNQRIIQSVVCPKHKRLLEHPGGSTRAVRSRY